MRIRTLCAALAVLALAGCTPAPGPKNTVTRSFYLGKKLMRFEMDQGYCYARERLPNGLIRNYWSSDTGRELAIVQGRDDRFPDRCELALITDASGRIRSIRILEDSPICIGVLR